MNLTIEDNCITKREIKALCEKNSQIEYVSEGQIRIRDFNHTIQFPRALSLDYVVNCINTEIRRGNNKSWSSTTVKEIVV